MAWTAPRTWVAGEVVTAAIMNTHVRDNLLETLQRDGSVVLTAAWDAGSYQIRAETFQSDIATGTAPLTVASATVVTNLNADQVDGQSRALTINADHTHQATGANGGQLDHGLALTGLTDDDHTQYQKENLLTTAGDIAYATAASTWARLPIGTASQVLRTNAGATAPEWFTPVLGISTGSYTGDGTQNRAIAHGLGIVPKMVFCYRAEATSGQGARCGFLRNGWAAQFDGVIIAVTAPTSTNFYVGGAGAVNAYNNNTEPFEWVAIG